MRFSIIMPTKDRPDWINRTIDSLLAQTLPDWELLVGDSSDSPIEGILPQDPRIKYHRVMGPVWDVINFLEQKVEGEIVVVLPDDDLFFPDTLEKVSAKIAEGYAWVHGSCQLINREGQECGGFGHECSMDELLDNNCISGISVFWKKECQQGQLQPSWVGYAGDYYWNLKLYQLFGAPGFIPGWLAQHTVHPGRITSRLTGQQLNDAARVRKHWRQVRQGPVRVMLSNRDHSAWVGGDAIQVNETRGALADIGFLAGYTCDANLDLRDWELVHNFHLNFTWSRNLIRNAQRHKKPYVISSIFYPTQDVGVSFAEQREMALGAEAIVALSSFEKQEIAGCLGADVAEKVVLIPNGAPPRFLTPPPNPARPNKEPYVLSVGRLEALKGHHRILEACKRIGAQLVVAGGSGSQPDRDLLYKSDYPRLLMLGEVDQAELARWYWGAQVFVQASMSERMSLTVLEAGAAGCNLIVTPHNGGNEWLPGLRICDPENYDALAEAIGEELAKPRDHAGWHDFIAKNLTWQHVAWKLRQLYDQAL